MRPHGVSSEANSGNHGPMACTCSVVGCMFPALIAATLAMVWHLERPGLQDTNS